MSDLSITSLQNRALQGIVNPLVLVVLNLVEYLNFDTVWYFAFLLGEGVRPAISSLPVSHVLCVQQEEGDAVLLACTY